MKNAPHDGVCPVDALGVHRAAPLLTALRRRSVCGNAERAAGRPRSACLSAKLAGALDDRLPARDLAFELGL